MKLCGSLSIIWLAFLCDWNEIWPFPVLWPLLSFQICWHIQCSSLTASCFTISDGSTGIPSPPLSIHFFNLFILNGRYLLYNIVVVLPYIDMNQPWVYVCSPSCVPLLPPSPPHPSGHPSTPVLSTLSHASNLDWWSVSHMIIYMFLCYSLKSSHLPLFPQSPKDCSIHLCLFAVSHTGLSFPFF